jgi:hypothetical protein
MKEIELPIVSGDLSLTDAQSLLKERGCAALIVERQYGCALYSAGRIALGRKQHAKDFNDLQPDMRPPAITALGPAVHTLGTTAAIPEASPAGRVTGNSFNTQPQTRRVRLMDGLLADIYVAPPKDYYCDGPRHHPFPPPDVMEGDDCPSGDGHRIICAK